MNGRMDQRIATELARHPAVAAAAVQGDERLIAYLVPDERYAPVLHRACRMAAAGSLAGLSLHEPAGQLLVAQLNRTETDFLYREIFVENAYLRHGIGLPAAPVVMDVGANIGMFSLLVAQRSHGARILAVEPVAELAHAVSVNAELHGVDVTVLNCGLGSRTGEAAFCYYPNNTLMSGMYGDAEEDRTVLRSYLRTALDLELLDVDPPDVAAQFDRLVDDRMRAQPRRCRLTTLTEVLATHRIDRIDLLKIDVEKAEADVLAGIDQTTWERIDQIVVEVHDLDGRLRAVLDQVAAQGFDVVHEQDRRLARTPCHTVYARRPGARPPAPVEPPPAQSRAALIAELRAFVTRRLVDLPLPDEVVWVDRIDAPDALAGVQASTPTGRASAVLSGAWTELFGAGSDTPDADFFTLGGDSLTAVRLLAKIETHLGEEIVEPDLIFTTTRFADLAAAIAVALRLRDEAGGGNHDAG
ncbi:MAG: FkbM family methyltransferase [Pseudonocardiaceae bacterium]